MTDDDRTAVARQLGRSPRSFLRVAARCPWGRPRSPSRIRTTKAESRSRRRTTLTCRHLVAAISRLEAAGGVERWSEAAADDEELRASLEQATAQQRTIRRALAADRTGADHGASLELGIGGSATPGRLKCLHAHAAFALARPGYALGERILAEVEPLWPDGPLLHAPAEPGTRIAADGGRRRERAAGLGGRLAPLQEESRDRGHAERLSRQVEVVTDELRRRVGGTFTLAELATVYADAERWARAAVAERGPIARLAADSRARAGRRLPSLRARRARLRPVSCSRPRRAARPPPSGARGGARAVGVAAGRRARVPGRPGGRPGARGRRPVRAGTVTQVRTLTPARRSRPRRAP